MTEDGPDPEDRPPLYRAVEDGDIERARALLAAGAPVDEGLPEWTPLQCALEAGGGPDERALWRLLLAHGADIHQPTWESGLTLLMCAAMEGDVELIRLALEQGVDLHLRIRDGEGPAVWFAAVGGHRAAMECLLDCEVERLEAALEGEVVGAGDPLRWPVESSPGSGLRYRAVLGPAVLARLEVALERALLPRPVPTPPSGKRSAPEPTAPKRLGLGEWVQLLGCALLFLIIGACLVLLALPDEVLLNW